MKKMCRLFVLISLFLCMLLMGACGSKKVTETEVPAETETKEQDAETTEKMETGQIISISMKEMEEKLAAKETFLVSFVTIDCPYCQDFHSMLVDYIQDHMITMYQVILDYEEEPEEENRAKIATYFSEFNTVPGVFYVVEGENGSYLDTYHLGVGMEPFDEWVQENHIENK